MVRFAIVCLGRTGSELLVSLLDSHPDIACAGEIFRQNAGNMRGLTAGVMPGWNANACGMKLPWEAFEVEPDLFDVMREFDFRVIRLTRRNLLDQYFSMRFSLATGDWSSTGAGYGAASIEVDPQHAIGFMRYFRTCNLFMREATRTFPAVDLFYEDIATGDGIDRALTLLGVSPYNLTTPLKKQRTGRQSDGVSNYDALRRALAGTNWECHVTG